MQTGAQTFDLFLQFFDHQSFESHFLDQSLWAVDPVEPHLVRNPYLNGEVSGSHSLNVPSFFVHLGIDCEEIKYEPVKDTNEHG